MAKKTAIVKHAGGRPTLYQDDYVEQARKLCLQFGAIDKKLAEYFGVTETTVNNWKKEHPEFFESIKQGKDEYDNDKIVEALRNKALTGDVPAIKFWLTNRKSDVWAESKNIKVEARVEPINKPMDVFNIDDTIKSLRERATPLLNKVDDGGKLTREEKFDLIELDLLERQKELGDAIYEG